MLMTPISNRRKNTTMSKGKKKAAAENATAATSSAVESMGADTPTVVALAAARVKLLPK